MKTERWVGSWSTSPIHAGINFHGLKLNNFLFFTTARTIIRPTLDGDRVRILLSNRYGSRALKISAASIASLRDGALMSAEKQSITPLTFGGKPEVVIPAGGEVLSDTADFHVEALKKVAVSLYVRAAVMSTKGLYGSQTWLSPGNRTSNAAFVPLWHLILHSRTTTFYTNPFLARLDVLRDDDAHAIVIAGDSSLVNEIPYKIKERLMKAGKNNIAVLQQALQGNRVLSDGMGTVGNLFGESLLKRFEKDVLSCPGVSAILVKCGFNDIAHPRTKSLRGKIPVVSVQQIADGYREIIRRAHEKGAKVFLVDKSPSKGFERKLFFSSDLQWSEELQQQLDLLNEWIENNDEADGFFNVDFLRDGTDPFALNPAYTPDYVHLNSAGQQAFVDKLSEDMLN